MPFGKYVGEDIADLPDSYLTWLVEKGRLYGHLRAAVRREFRNRGFVPHDSEPGDQPPPPSTSAVSGIQVRPAERPLFAIVNAGYRALAIHYHPDRGGDPEAMRRLNLLAESLRRQLRSGHY
jgi:hypothetical protein